MFANPDKNVASLLLLESSNVAEFGSGNGFLTKSLAKRVGHTGHVFAIEVQKELVKKLEQDLKELHIYNASVIWGDAEVAGGTKLSAHIMDAVIISNILFQVEDRLGLIDEAKRILKPSGRVLFIDWSEFPNGSHRSDLWLNPSAIGQTYGANIISPKKAKDLFLKRGFKFVENILGSDHHYGIIFKYE